MPKSGAHEDHTAPIDAAPRKAIDRLGHVGQVAGDPVAALHAEPAQGRGERADLAAQRRPGDLDRLGVLGDDDQRRVLVGGVPQRLLGVVDRRRPGTRRRRASRGGSAPGRRGRRAARRSRWRRRPRTGRGARPTSARARRSRCGSPKSSPRRSRHPARRTPRSGSRGCTRASAARARRGSLAHVRTMPSWARRRPRRATDQPQERPCSPEPPDERNVLGGPLQPCGTDPVTGFYRDGHCSSGPEDLGSHTVCAVVSADFLDDAARPGQRPVHAAARSTASPGCGRATGGASSPSAGCRPTRPARPRASCWPRRTSARWRSCRSRRCASTPSTSPTTSAAWNEPPPARGGIEPLPPPLQLRRPCMSDLARTCPSPRSTASRRRCGALTGGRPPSWSTWPAGAG